MAMRKMTLALARRRERLREARDKATQAVYAVEESRSVPFAACLRMAEPGVRDAYKRAVSDLAAFEAAMIAEGRGYRTSLGGFAAN